MRAAVRIAYRVLRIPENTIYAIRNAQHAPRRLAVAAMLAAGFLLAVMGLTTKMLGTPALVGRAMPASEVALWRFGFGILAMLPLRGRRGISLLGHDRRGLLLRGLWGGLAVFFYFLSLQATSLTKAQLLNYTSLLFAPVFAFLFLRERLSPRAVAAIAVAAVGILLVTLAGRETGGLNLGDGYGLISGVLAGAAITEVRRLRRGESAWSIFFYLCVVGFPIALAGCAAQRPVWPAGAGWLVLLAMAVSSVGGQLLMTYGYKHVRAGEGNLITMSQIAYNAVAGALLFGEVLTGWTLLGGGLILGAGACISLTRER